MKKLKSVLLLTIIALVTARAQEEPRNEWTLTIEPVYMSAYNDFRAGDIYNFYVTILDIPPNEEIPGEYTVRYGTSYNPVILTMPPKPTLIWEIQHKADDEKWGVGMRGWKFKNLSQEGSTIYQPDTKQNEDGTSEFIHGFRMLGYTFLPNGDLPIDWWAKNHLDLWTREIYASKTFSRSLNMRFGIKLVEIFNTLDIGQRHWTSENTNKIYRMTSEIDYLLMGPNIGLDVRAKHIDVFIQQAVLFGTARHIGDWNVEYYKTEYGEEIIDSSQKYHSAYNVPLNTHSQEIIPATEISIKLTILKKQFSNNRSVQFGTSLFSAAFWWTPIAPRWKIGPPDWHKKRQDALMAGITFFTKINF